MKATLENINEVPLPKWAEDFCKEKLAKLGPPPVGRGARKYNRKTEAVALLTMKDGTAAIMYEIVIPESHDSDPESFTGGIFPMQNRKVHYRYANTHEELFS